MIRGRFLLLGLLLLPGCVTGPDDVVSLPVEERQKITELVLSVAEDPEETLKPAHDELWMIFKKHGPPTPKQIERLKLRFRTIGEGHRLFWLDAREALKNHRLVKSPERIQWEEGLSRDGWFSARQRERFDELMKQVIEENPIASNHGVEVSFSRAMVDEIVNSWDEAELERSVDALLTPTN